jgi:SAM-dependent methyltransferase
MDIKEQDILGADIGKHWYYRAKGEAMLAMLDQAPVRHVLDVGAGSGVFSRLLLDRGADLATCVDPGYPSDHIEAHGNKPIRFVRGVENADADTVLLMDVLEHVDDDVGLLRDYAARAPHASRFLITVPAFKFLWSGHDVFLEHRRRYTLQEMEGVVHDAGLKPALGCYFFGLVFPLAAGRRLVGRMLTGGGEAEAKSDLQRHSPSVNDMLYQICHAELGVFKANKTAGLSVFCLAVRK